MKYKTPVTIGFSVITILASFLFAASASAQTIMPDGAICPAGMTCIRTVQATPVACPLGYTCRPQTGTASTASTYVPSTIYAPGSAYTPGSFTNSTSGSLNAGLPAGTMTAAQYQTSVQTQGQAAAQAQLQASLQSQLTSTTTPSASGSSTQSFLGVARVGTGFYVPAFGQHIKSVCGPNQFMNVSVAPQGCMNNFATNAPITLNPSIPFNPTGVPMLGGIITDSYCPGVISYDAIPGSHNISDASPTADRLGDKSPNYASLTQKQNCVIGEASRNKPYVNPWVSLYNLFGLVNVKYPDAVLKGTTHVGTNYCKDAISLTEAKNRNSTLLATRVTSDLYTSNSRLYVPYSPSLSEVEDLFKQLEWGTQKWYWWNGTFAGTVGDPSTGAWFTNSDIKDPEFLSLFNALQIGTGAPLGALQKCMDPGYVSNFPAVAGHYQSVMLYLKSVGLVQ